MSDSAFARHAEDMWHRFPHPWMILSCLAFAALYCGQWVALSVHGGVSAGSVVMLCLQVGALTLTAFRPLPGCWALAVVYCLGYVVPAHLPSFFVLAFFLAIAAAGFLSLFHALLITVILSCATTALVGNGIHELAILLAMGIALSFLGTLMHLVERLARNHRMRERRRENMRLASALHDKLCNELTILQLRLRQDESFMNCEHADDYVASLQEAIAQTRQLIRLAETGGDARNRHDVRRGTAPTPRRGDLREAVERREAELSALGWDGTVLCTITDPSAPSARASALTNALIDEVFGNIARHAAQADGYFFSLMENAGGITVSTSDTPLPDDHQADDEGGSTGLARLRSRILDMGGTFEVESDPGCFSLLASIPPS